MKNLIFILLFLASSQLFARKNVVYFGNGINTNSKQANSATKDINKTFSVSLGGIDSDNNGIRDDVDDYINKKYTKPKEKAFAQQIARAYQNILLMDKNNIKRVMEVARKTTYAVVCTVDIAPDKPILEDIKAITLNTRQRVREFFKYDDLLDGSVTSLPEGDTCER